MASADFYQLMTIGFLVVALLALWQLSRIGSILEQVRDSLGREEVPREGRGEAQKARPQERHREAPGGTYGR